MNKYDVSQCCQFCDCGADFCGDPCSGRLRAIQIIDEETGEKERLLICQSHHADLIEFKAMREEAERQVSKIPKHELN